MNYYKMTIAYDGSKYDGWQKQNNTSKTIQEKIENALSAILDTTIEINGAGRTDAGVHALMQTASFSIAGEIDCSLLCRKLADILPFDIAVLSIDKMNGRFHARLNATGKIYRYRIFTGYASPVFDRSFVFHHRDKLNLDIIRKVADEFVGTHDFKLFQDNRHMKKSTVRTIHSIHVDSHDNYIDITFTGDGFMYHMIRHLVGIMLYYASEKEPVPDNFFNIDVRNKNWPLAPAKGLTLVKVLY